MGKKGFPWVKWLIVAVLFFSGGMAVYLYLAVSSGSAVRIEEDLNRALKTRGFDVAVKVSRNGMVHVTGTAQNSSDKKSALAIIGSHGDAQRVIDNIQVRASRVDIENDLNEAMDNQGLTGVQAQVDQDFTAVLIGRVKNKQEKAEALRIVKSYQGVKGVVDDVRVERPLSLPKSEEGALRFVETKDFRLSGLSPSSWASMKYRDSIAFQVPGPGRVLMEGAWQNRASLALILSRADSGTAYAQKDGLSPLKVVHRITSQDLAQGGRHGRQLWPIFPMRDPLRGVLR